MYYLLNYGKNTLVFSLFISALPIMNTINNSKCDFGKWNILFIVQMENYCDDLKFCLWKQAFEYLKFIKVDLLWCKSIFDVALNLIFLLLQYFVFYFLWHLFVNFIFFTYCNKQLFFILIDHSYAYRLLNE